MSLAHRPRRPYITHDRPLFFAHRGGSLVAPENTLVAFERGVSYGADALETDIQMTRDGEIVVMHDPTVDRTTDGQGAAASFTLEELRRLDAGYRFTNDGGTTHPYRGQGVTIPTLRELLERFPDKRVNIDLKADEPEREQRLWRIIQETDSSDRVLIGSEDHAPMVRFRQLTGGRVATSATRPEITGFLLRSWVGMTSGLNPAFDALQVPESHRGIRVVSRRFLRAAHRLGIDVHVWTIDDRSTMEKLLALGVDGLMTDRPDILAQIISATNG